MEPPQVRDLQDSRSYYKVDNIPRTKRGYRKGIKNNAVCKLFCHYYQIKEEKKISNSELHIKLF